MKERLVTPSYCWLLAANFLLYFGFYLLIPVMPFYLEEVFSTPHGKIGLILSCYTVAALFIRPFSGYLLDAFARKPLYLLSYFIFTSLFVGYMLAATIVLFVMVRVMHGLAFGTVTVAGNTIVIDIMPSSRRGEGLGYYGLANNIAMATGPMTGLFLHDHYSYSTIFTFALVSCATGLIAATFVKTPYKAPVKREPISMDRFILLKGLPVGLALLLLSIPYGMTTTYVAMYAREIGVGGSAGLFFSLLAVGTATARVFSGRLVDKGYITNVISVGTALVCICFFVLSSLAWLAESVPVAATAAFYILPLFLGLGFGSMFPAFNTMFVNLAENNQRGTGTSTYLISWDVGIGIGLTMGGWISELMSFQSAYLYGACLTVLSFLYFKYVVTPYYHQNKLR